MEVHGFVTFLIGTMLGETRASAFDLHTTTRFLLNVLDISTTMTYHLRSKIKARNRFQIDWNLFFRPFSSAILIAFKLLRLTAFESSFVHKIGQVLFHHFVDLFHSLLKPLFGSARNMKVQGRVLKRDEYSFQNVKSGRLTAAVAMLLSG